MYMSKGFLLVSSLRACKNCQLYNTAESNFKRYFHHSLLSCSPVVGREDRFSPRDVKLSKETLFTSKPKIKESGNFSGDPDVFGTLSGPVSAEIDFNTDEGDHRETVHLEQTVDRTYKLSTKQYADMIKEHLDKKDLQGAIEVLQERMLKQDQVKPENYIYNLLIGACGRMGHAKQAFHLFNQMKKRGLKVTGGTYTGLFNACATSFYPLDGLKRAKHLRELMIEKGYEPNETNYHSMIKAFGRCGDTATAFSLMDEMMSRGHAPSDEAFNFLLQACVSDTEVGYRHALLVWRKMRDFNVKPTIYSYNLILKVVKNCGLGKVEDATEILEKIAGPTQKLLSSKVTLLDEEDSQNNMPGSTEPPGLPTQTFTEDCAEPKEVAALTRKTALALPKKSVAVTQENWPNLLATTPHLGDVVSLSEVVTPQDRLLLLGGFSAFLAQMTQDGAQPDIKTFTQLLEVLPGTVAAEKALMSAMKRSGIQADISFFNMLIKKRAMRFDYDSARQVLTLVSSRRLIPNEMTFGVLALGCKTHEQAMQLLADTEAAGFRINIQIVGALLKHACLSSNFGYILEMMETVRRQNLAPNAQFYGHLNRFYQSCRQMIFDKQNGRPGCEFVSKDYFRKGYRIFSARYKIWLTEVQEQVPPSKSDKSSDQKYSMSAEE